MIRRLLGFFLKQYRLRRDYVRDWVSPEGKAYRDRTYRRQKKDGENPLVSNPTYDEMRVAFDVYYPESILEVGCGWGRILEELQDEYNIEGCDVAQEYLDICNSTSKVFYYDVAVNNDEFISKNANHWDVLFTRAVMLYFMEVPEQMEIAMRNMEKLAKKKVIFWEWPEVCEKMESLVKSDKFEYRPIEHRTE